MPPLRDSLHLREAAIYEQFGSRDVAAVVGGENATFRVKVWCRMSIAASREETHCCLAPAASPDRAHERVKGLGRFDLNLRDGPPSRCVDKSVDALI